MPFAERQPPCMFTDDRKALIDADLSFGSQLSKFYLYFYIFMYMLFPDKTIAFFLMIFPKFCRTIK